MIFQGLSQDPRDHLKWRALQQYFTALLIVVVKLFILDICGGPGYTSENSAPDGICLLKVSKRNTRARCETCSKLTKKTPEKKTSGVFIVNFEHVNADWHNMKKMQRGKSATREECNGNITICKSAT